MEEPLHRVGGIMPIGYIINQSMPLFLDCHLLISIDQDLFWPCLPVVSFYFLFFISPKNLTFTWLLVRKRGVLWEIMASRSALFHYYLLSFDGGL